MPLGYTVNPRGIPGALAVYERQTPEVFPTGIAAIDREIGGIPKGALTQVPKHSESSARLSELEECGAGLICLTGDEHGPLACALQDGGIDAGRKLLNKLTSIFGHSNVYVELQRHFQREQDPLIHDHAVVFNLSYDGDSGKWKALNARGFYERRSYLSEVYRNTLAHEVKRLGYEVENHWNDRGTDQTFEIKGISPALCKQFSKRSAEKEAAIKEFIAKNGRNPSNGEIAVLVRNTRPDKLREITTAEVKARQRAQLTPEDAKILRTIREQAEKRDAAPVFADAVLSLEYAKEHLFERTSVARDHELLTEALHHGRGHIDLAALKAELNGQQRSGALIGVQGQVATKESLKREQKMIAAINRGNGCHEMFCGDTLTFEPKSHLSGEQKKAVGFILRSKDFGVCLQGAAGTGKTDTLQEIKRGLIESGHDVAGLVKSVDAKGRIHLEDGRMLPANYRQFKYGYAMTAHRSQGKSADAVIVSADKMDGDLFYVGISRGKEHVRVLTSNLPLLRQSVAWDSTWQSATELVKETERKEKQNQRRTAQAQKAAQEWHRKLFINSRNARTHFITPTLGHQKAGPALSEG